MTLHCDILICGGALNGLATALALSGRHATRPLDVVIADRRDPRDFAREGFDGRASAIVASSRRMFEALGIWDGLASHAEPVRRIDVTDESGEGPARPALLQFADLDQAPFHMVENRHLYAALAGAVTEAPAIRLLTGESAEHFRFGPGLAEVSFSGGTEVKAGLVVAADGRGSMARAAAGIGTWGWDYGQTGIATRAAHEAEHGGVAVESFRPDGPFAILPLPGRVSSVVWCLRHDRARAVLALDDEGFTAALNQAFGGRLGAVRPEGPRHGFPLALGMAKALTGPRLALIGDAGHAVHPLAGLGFNLGLRDAAALAECVSEAVAIGLDPGGGAVLERYARWRRFDTATTAFLTDGFNRLFSNDTAGLSGLRQAGLLLANLLTPLKPLVMREAAGELGSLPKLLRGEPL